MVQNSPFSCVIRYLQDSSAVRMPAAVSFPNRQACNANALVMEFWKGTKLVGPCKLPLEAIHEKMAAQVRRAVHSFLCM